MIANHPRRTALTQIFVVSVPFAIWLFGMRFVAPASPRAGAALVLHVVASALLAMLLVAAALAREPDRLRAVGLGPLRPAAVGLGIAAALLAYLAQAAGALAYFVVTRAALAEEIAGKAKWTARLAQISPAWIVPLVIVVGFYEEVLFRGFLLGRLRVLFCSPAIGPRAEVGLSVVISSILFALGHAYQGALGMVQTFAMGATLAIITVRAASVWPAVVAHAVIDGFGLFVLHGLS